MISKKIFGLGVVAVALVIFSVVISRKETPGEIALPKTAADQDEPIPAAQPAVTSQTAASSRSLPQNNSVEEKIARLQEIGTRNDSESYEVIVSELTNSFPEIRRAALDAVIQFGSRDAIPVLKEVAAKTEDAREKVQILDAIEFLELPSLTEVKRTRPTISVKP